MSKAKRDDTGMSVGDAVDHIIDKSVDAYLGKPEPEHEPALEMEIVPEPELVEEYEAPPEFRSRRRRTRSEKDDYAKRVPAIVTPSVLTKARVDAKLVRLRGEFQLRDGRAEIDAAAWDMLVETVMGYLLDVCEGSGMILRSGADADRVRAAVEGMMRDSFRVNILGEYWDMEVKDG